jgi:RNA:NAD 2'-phosphotransferase (TPT1/KptA family)
MSVPTGRFWEFDGTPLLKEGTNPLHDDISCKFSRYAKNMSFSTLLRHNVWKPPTDKHSPKFPVTFPPDGLPYSQMGFVLVDKNFLKNIDHITQGDSGLNRRFRGFESTPEYVQYVVTHDPKNRMTLLTDIPGGTMWIRCNQGHSGGGHTQTKFVTQVISDTVLPKFGFHGTALKNTQSIWETGILPMGRDVHMIFPSRKDPSMPDPGATSGLRTSSEAIVVVDIEKASTSGCVFRVSTNNVLLTSDPIRPEFLVKIYDRVSLETLKECKIKNTCGDQ